MKHITVIAILICLAAGAYAQQTTFRRDTTGGFNGVYCIGPLDLEAGPMIIKDNVTITKAEYKTLDPKEVLYVKVYKDTLATALYGQSGTNGVIVITTKRKNKASK